MNATQLASAETTLRAAARHAAAVGDPHCQANRLWAAAHAARILRVSDAGSPELRALQQARVSAALVAAG